MVTNGMRQTSLRRKSPPHMGGNKKAKRRRRKSSNVSLDGKGRMLMRDWLICTVNKGNIRGLEWLNPERTLLKVPWKHASRRGWQANNDACIFIEWAKYTGKINEPAGSAKKWKANFRCAMNSLPDVEEVKEKSNKNGDDAYRVYTFYEPGTKVNKQLRQLSSESWPAFARRDRSRGADFDRDESARAVDGLQRHERRSSASSSYCSMSDGDGEPSPNGGRGSHSSYTSSGSDIDNSRRRPVRTPCQSIFSASKDVPVCVEEVEVTSTTGIEFSRVDLQMNQHVTDFDSQMNEHATDFTCPLEDISDDENVYKAEVPLTVEDFNEPLFTSLPIPLSSIPLPKLIPIPTIPPIGSVFLANKAKKKRETIRDCVSFAYPVNDAWSGSNPVISLPTSVAKEFGMQVPSVTTLLTTRMEFTANDDVEDSAAIRHDVSFSAL